MKAVTALKGMTPMQVIQKYQALRGQRTNFEDTWQGIGEYAYPRKSDFQITRTPGEPIYTQLLDNTAVNSGELLAGALHSMLTNPTGFFFGLTSGDPVLDANDNVRKWIQKTVRDLHDTMSNSNFHTEVHEYYLDIVHFANGGMTIEEDDEFVVRYGARALKELFVEENSKGVVDSIFRMYSMDARGLCDDFGYDELPEKIQKAYDANKSDKFEVIHATYPRSRVKDSKGVHAYVSQYVLVSERLDLSIKGFMEFPWVFARWSKASGEVYGRGCGEKALPVSKMLNKMQETTIKGAQKTIDPPLQAPDDGFVMPLKTQPAGLNYFRAGSEDRITPIFADARIDFGYQAIDRAQQQIRESYYVDQLKLREGPQMTALEVQERVEQGLRFLGPMLGRQETEFLQRVVERTFAIMKRKGKISEPPAELANVPLKVRYTSLMAMSQRASEVTNIQRTMGAIAPFMSLDPSVGDNFHGDNAVRYIAKLHNYPQELIRDEKDRTQIREDRAKAQEEAKARADEMANTDNAAKVIGMAGKVQQAQG
jgi:hypothetical protein